MLDLMEDAGVRGTCFFLGWVGKKYSHLVREASARGHEIASHGYAHRLVDGLSPAEFYEDSLHARKTLEDLTGSAVLGYRAPGFSVTEKTPWVFDRLVEAGYRYDSSVFPAPRQHGGMRKAPRSPYRIQCASGVLVEFPMTVATFLGKPVCVSGGGYLRIFPSFLICKFVKQVLGENRPVIIYIHPREIDPQQPRLPMSLKRRFKTYVNLRSTRAKLRRLFAQFEMTTFRDYLAARPHLAAPQQIGADVMSAKGVQDLI